MNTVIAVVLQTVTQGMKVKISPKIFSPMGVSVRGCSQAQGTLSQHRRERPDPGWPRPASLEQPLWGSQFFHKSHRRGGGHKKKAPVVWCSVAAKRVVGSSSDFPAGAVLWLLWKAALQQSCTDAVRWRRRPSAQLASPGWEGLFRGRWSGFSVFSPSRPQWCAQSGGWKLLPRKQLPPHEKHSCGFAAAEGKGGEQNPSLPGGAAGTGGARPHGAAGGGVGCAARTGGLCHSRLFCVSTTVLSVVITLSCE